MFRNNISRRVAHINRGFNASNHASSVQSIGSGGVMQTSGDMDEVLMSCAKGLGSSGVASVDGNTGSAFRAHSTWTQRGDCNKIIYTYTDEAPMLATYSLLPIVRAFTKSSGIRFELKDISLAGRIVANFSEYLEPDQRISDSLHELGMLTQSPEANIIKLPNISASLPQLTAAISELQSKGYKLPDYPVEPKNSAEKEIAERYGRVIGSSVNPVLREGNSDRRVAAPVKACAQRNPHKLYSWGASSKTSVAHMTHGDFFGSEKSHVVEWAQAAKIQFVDSNGKKEILKYNIALEQGEVVDAARMSSKALSAFFEEQIEKCRQLGPEVILSLHLKATMMKVSDPIMFGKAVKAFYKPVWNKYESLFEELKISANNGIADLYEKIKGHPLEEAIRSDIAAVYKHRPGLAMVDSSKGITSLHAPNNVIIDASVPPVIRDGGKMWNTSNELADTLMLIPDRSYATMYSAIIEDCKTNGTFDVRTMGNVANVGLMARKAEEYGSHDKTFVAPGSGVMQIISDDDGKVIFSHEVEKGDIWRMCQTKDIAIKDWVRLAVHRARVTGSPAVFWLDSERAHDSVCISKARKYLEEHDTSGLDIVFLRPEDAMRFTLDRVRKGLNTISVTGNVLRDYLTDLFPILELGTSAKMLSIIPLLAGGGLYETGAGGSAPKHVEQLVMENHLRWDSLGEFLALAVSFEDLARNTGNQDIQLLGESLNAAIGRLLNEGKSPKRKVSELDCRGSHFYLALYWAEALANLGGRFSNEFSDVAKLLKMNEEKILSELHQRKGTPVNLGGYFKVNPDFTESIMRPSNTLNEIIDSHIESVG